MHKKTKNMFIDKNLNLLTSQFCEALNSALESFWEQDTKVILQAVNDYREIRDEKLISNLDFFSSQIKVENHKPVIIRLSKEFVENILQDSLEANFFAFKFSEITPLEIKILNGFCEFLYKKLKEILIPPNVAKLSEKSEKNINLLFIIPSKSNTCSKMMISIPQDRINLETVKQIQNFKDEDFLNSSALIRLKAGSSKITLEELQNLAPDDIIVLENSELSKMILLSGEVENKFNIKINPSLIVNLDENEGDEEDFIQTYEEVKMEKNLWDDIQIEINAEFEKVKMTIGELKQISQGQIVDLGSIFDNEISLFVEERKVAKGELIIINDRYAVRLNEVLSTNTPKTAPAPAKTAPAPAQAQVKQPAPQPKPQAAQVRPQPAQNRPIPTRAAQAQPKQPAPQPKPQAKPQAAEDEEFDYSDFEK